jgi:hypothetical protein
MHREFATAQRNTQGAGRTTSGYRLVDKISFIIGAMIAITGAMIILTQGASLFL